MTRITDEDVLMAVATDVPNDFDGDPVELFDSRYRDVCVVLLMLLPSRSWSFFEC